MPTTATAALLSACADVRWLPCSYGSSSAADQVLVDGVHVVIVGRDRIHRKIFFHHDLVQELIELVGIASADENALAVIVQLGFHHVVLRKQAGGEQAGLRAADKNLHGMFFYFSADTMNLSFRDDIAVTHEHNLIRNLIDLVQDMAGDDYVQTLLTQRFKQSDRF